jgi:hypothetical protein
VAMRGCSLHTFFSPIKLMHICYKMTWIQSDRLVGSNTASRRFVVTTHEYDHLARLICLASLEELTRQ